MRHVLALAGLFALTSVLTGDLRVPAQRPVLPRVIAGVTPAADFATVVSVLEREGLRPRPLPDLRAVEFDGVASDRMAEIRRVPGVRYVEPVRAVIVADVPGDPLYARQSAYLSAEGATQAWDISQGDPSVIVAVVDTGIDILHPDLAPNIWVNPGEVPNNGQDDDGNGCVDDVNGCAFVSDSSPGCQNITNGFVNDDIGHGTFVAGIIGAAANGIGIVGVARNARIMPVKVLDCYGSGDSVAAARGVVYAVRNGARVVNLSLGGLEDAQVLRDAIAEATASGALVVAAAGNSGIAGVAFPARIPEVLAVGASVQGSPPAPAPFSSYGPEVDVVAAGEDVLGTVPRSHCPFFIRCIGLEPYGAGDGTSFSAPQASGLAALMFSLRPGLSPADVTELIRSTATPGSGPDDRLAAGRINMAAALRAAQANRPPGDPCTVETVVDGDTFTCSGGRTVRMLQMDAPDLGQCGGDWAKAAAQYIFLTPGREVSLRYDATLADAAGRTLAVPIWRGNDGADYNLAIVMVYVGLARAADVGAGNVAYRDWAFAAQNWAAAAQWNMWAPGRTFNGGC